MKGNFMYTIYQIKNGKAWSNVNNEEVSLKGYFEIDDICTTETNQNGTIKYIYNINKSEITTNSGNIFTSGSGKINIVFEKTEGGYDNMSEWNCGDISTSLVESDVIFYDNHKNPYEINDYNKLPPVIHLNNGIYFQNYESINLTLCVSTEIIL